MLWRQQQKILYTDLTLEPQVKVKYTKILFIIWRRVWEWNNAMQ